MLSSSRKSAPASTASVTWSMVSHSTWTVILGARSRTSATASATDPAAATWLSLTMATS
jgi:hypothetical protein